MTLAIQQSDKLNYSGGDSSFSHIRNTISTSLRNMVYNYSIPHAMDLARLETEREKQMPLSRWEKARYGAETGVFQVGRAIALSVTFSLASRMVRTSARKAATQSLRSIGFKSIALTAPLIEEIVFRGGIQRSFHFVQNMARRNLQGHSPRIAQEVKNHYNNDENPNFLVNPSSAILLSNTLFAAVHLRNAGSYLTASQAIMQCTNIFLTPVYGILFYTTGDLSAPVAAHMTNNGLVYSLVLMKGGR